MKIDSSYTLNQIAIKKLQAVVVSSDTIKHEVNPTFCMTLNAEMMSLGFMMSEQLFNVVKILNAANVGRLYQQIIPVLKQLTGADVLYQPLYPNFPQQVMEATDVELYLNAIFHYWSEGEWLPEYRELKKTVALEAVKYRQIDLVTPASVRAVFTTLLASRDSLSAEDKEIVAWFLQNIKESKLKYPEEIPFLENKCVVAALLLEQDKDISPLVDTATDILRIATYLSEGDVSLAENTQFKSLSRPLREVLVKQLERVINEEDIGRHRKKWVKLFHNLHVGDYSMKVYKIALKARNNLKLNSFNGTLEYYLTRRYMDKALPLLVSRPGEFGRRLDHVLRLASETGMEKEVVKQFLPVVNNIPSRNLLQLLGHLHSRNSTMDSKVVYPKGSVQKAVIIDTPLLNLDSNLIQTLVTGLSSSLEKRFSALEPMNKVWIDPALIDCPLPSQQRSAASSLFRVARGTRLPIDEDTELDANKNTLRFFIYWKGQDIDLSATFHNDAFAMVEHVSYTQLRSKDLGTYHSGDITQAPNGACEFIDIDIAQARNSGMRYVTMNVLVYSGPSFAEHEVCYAGWMTRSHPNSNEVFDAKTVKQKIDVTANCRNTIPVVFDLLNEKAIWVDLATSQRSQWGGNNIESNHASIEDKLKAVVTSYNKLSLYELFELHGNARGELVDNKKEADTVFSLTEGITPFNIDEINAEFIV